MRNGKLCELTISILYSTTVRLLYLKMLLKFTALGVFNVHFL